MIQPPDAVNQARFFSFEFFSMNRAMRATPSRMASFEAA
jgi:hypothetical protein